MFVVVFDKYNFSSTIYDSLGDPAFLFSDSLLHNLELYSRLNLCVIFIRKACTRFKVFFTKTASVINRTFT